MDLHARADRLAHLLEQKLDLHGTGFEAKVARAGRLLPRYLRADAALVIEAMKVEPHPKLSRQQDPKRIDRACDEIERYLHGINPWDRRRAIALNWLAGNAFNLIVVVVLVLAVLVWRGFL
ncbi:hypothetical protein [Aliiroseovarius subalbicans]|uniref:hypothetical protein n=1 Tax=Aliiroseovarius subalbicans TaxID=2925840 RepID=UPI001F59BCEF|nr:hypothetical protein [Aliiroseovarius subalbicans]MCI2399198.1 hypothetical protein [Aliiroseovarius subalbicans]